MWLNNYLKKEVNKILHINQRVITILGSGRITTYHSEAKLWAVTLDGYIGQEWFYQNEIENC